MVPKIPLEWLEILVARSKMSVPRETKLQGAEAVAINTEEKPSVSLNASVKEPSVEIS